MNPAHRDRIAFLRICSGKFERGMTVNLSRTGKPLNFLLPHNLWQMIEVRSMKQ